LSPFQAAIDRSLFGIAPEVAATIASAAQCDRARIAYRDVASATNKLTLIAARLPAGVVSTHTVFCLKTPLADRAQWCLLALLNSLVANYLVRMHVTTHVTTALMARLPVPRPDHRSREFRQLAKLSKRLAATGVSDESADYAELNAVAAGLYGVSTDEYACILESFPLISTELRERCSAAYSTNNLHRTTETQNHRSKA
jgi:hypothetical protein